MWVTDALEGTHHAVPSQMRRRGVRKRDWALGRKAPEWVTFSKTVLDTKTAPELGDGNRRRGRYRTAMVTPGCEGSPPTEMDSGTATPGVTSGGTNAFTCRAPEIRPGAAP